MQKFIEHFTRFVNISLRVLLIPVIYSVFLLLKNYLISTHNGLSVLLLAFSLLCFAALYWSINKGYKENIILSAIVILALILRIGYVLSINNIPVSDFGLIYETAEKLLNGNYSAFRGSGYIARFPHITIITLYYSLLRKVFLEPLITIKLINSVFSSVNVILVYFISKECFNNSKKPLWAAMLTALSTPLIVYNAAYNSENIAIPFYLASCYVFILVMNKKKTIEYLLLSGLLLTIGHLFRMAGQVMIIAFLMYIIIYFKKRLLDKCKAIVYVLSSFMLPLIIVSNLLIAAEITEVQLWKGSEPVWTSVLRGTNLESGGRWNYDDAIIPETYNFDYDKVSDASKAIIKERLTTTPLSKLSKFYINKFSTQWSEGDFCASYWAQLSADEKDIVINIRDNGRAYYQLSFFILIVSFYLGLYNKNQYLKNHIINLFYIIFCGYALLFLIIESQERYGFIACWLFIFLSLTPDWESINKKLFWKKKYITSVNGGLTHAAK